MSKPVLGFSIGSTNIYGAYYNEDHTTVITNTYGNKATHLIASFTDEEILLGEAADSIAETNKQNTISKVIQFLGIKYDDPKFEKLASEVSFTVFSSNSGTSLFEVEYRQERKKYTPEDILRLFLNYFRNESHCFPVGSIAECVIAIPMNFTSARILSLKNAVQNSQIELLDEIVTEPVAAAYAYDLFKYGKSNSNIMFFDLGSSKCEVTILSIVQLNHTVLSNCIKEDIGGDFIDSIIADYVAENVSPPLTAEEKRLILPDCEKAKKTLSIGTNATVLCEGIGDIRVRQKMISKKDFIILINPAISECFQLVKQSLKEANLKPAHISNVVLMGGSSNIDVFSTQFREFFGRDIVLNEIDPSEVVAAGAAFKAAVIKNPSLLMSVEPETQSDEINYVILDPHDSDLEE